MTPVRLEPAALWSGVKHSTTEPLRSQQTDRRTDGGNCNIPFAFLKKRGEKHIRRDFHLVAWVMPQGWDLGVPWGVGGAGMTWGYHGGLGGAKKFFEIQPDLVCELLT